MCSCGLAFSWQENGNYLANICGVVDYVVDRLASSNRGKPFMLNMALNIYTEKGTIGIDYRCSEPLALESAETPQRIY